MKRYIKATTNGRKVRYVKASRGYDDIDDWYDDMDAREEDIEEFTDTVINILESKLPDAEVYEEPNTQGGVGVDSWYITIDGKTKTIDIDTEVEDQDIFNLGPAAAAKKHAAVILKKLK